MRYINIFLNNTLNIAFGQEIKNQLYPYAYFYNDTEYEKYLIFIKLK